MYDSRVISFHCDEFYLYTKKKKHVKGRLRFLQDHLNKYIPKGEN